MEIKHRITGEVIFACDTVSLKELLERAVREGTELYYADLGYAHLEGARLNGANLSRANLKYAEILGCDFRGSILAGARLIGAYIGGTDLREADLHDTDLYRATLDSVLLEGADLRYAKLCDARLDVSLGKPGNLHVNWNSRELISAILWNAASDHPGREQLAARIERKNWCWQSWKKVDHPEREWALEELRKWVLPDDDLPLSASELMKAKIPGR